MDHNGSQRHRRYKQKVSDLLTLAGFTKFGGNDDEVAIFRAQGEPPFYIDVCGCSDTRILVIEIDGYKGHKTKYSIGQDKNRLAFIKNVLGPQCETYRFAFWQLTPFDKETEKLVAQELRLY